MKTKEAESVCIQCGKKKPISAFRENPASKYGHVFTCKLCQEKDGKPNESDCPGRIIISGKHMEQEIALESPTLQLNFIDYPEIFRALKLEAKRQIRTIEHQALALLRAGL